MFLIFHGLTSQEIKKTPIFYLTFINVFPSLRSVKMPSASPLVFILFLLRDRISQKPYVLYIQEVCLTYV